MKKIGKLFAIISIFSIVSCDIEPIDPAIDLDDINTPAPVFKADFSGETWIADQVAAQVGGDFITIGGIKGSQDEGFGFIIEANQVGTYPANTNLLAYTPANSDYGYWSANPEDENENTGSITITNINTVAKTISGTFQFKGYWSDTDVTNILPVQFTNGVFTNIPYTDYEDENADSFFAKVNGVDFVDTDILVASVNDIIGIGAKNAQFESITIGVNESLDVGTYSITGNTTDMVQATYKLDENTSLLSSSGVVKVTEKTIDRIKGTFSFTVTNGATTYVISSGEFDVAY